MHIGGVPAGVDLSAHVAGGFVSVQLGGLPSEHFAGPDSTVSVLAAPDPDPSNLESSYVVVLPSEVLASTPSAQVVGPFPSVQTGFVLSVHVGGVPAGIVLSAQAGFALSEHVGMVPSEHLAGGAGLVPPDVGATGSAAEVVETNKQMTAIAVFLII